MDLGDAWSTGSPGRPGTSGRRSFASKGPARASDGAPRMSENNGPVPPGDNPYRAPDQEPFARYRANGSWSGARYGLSPGGTGPLFSLMRGAPSLARAGPSEAEPLGAYSPRPMVRSGPI